MFDGQRTALVYGLYLSVVHQVLPTLETVVEFWDPPGSDDLRTGQKSEWLDGERPTEGTLSERHQKPWKSTYLNLRVESVAGQLKANLVISLKKRKLYIYTPILLRCNYRSVLIYLLNYTPPLLEWSHWWIINQFTRQLWEDKGKHSSQSDLCCAETLQKTRYPYCS